MEDLYLDMELGIRQDDNGRTPVECITGDTPDVSKYSEYGVKDPYVDKELGIGETMKGSSC